MFSWRESSADIFNKISNSTSDESFYESDSDDDDLTSVSPTFVTASYDATNVASTLSDEEIDEKLKRWMDLTNITMGPYARGPITTELLEVPEVAEPEERDVDLRHKHKHDSSEGSSNDGDEYADSDGQITFKFQFLIISEILKVTIVKADNLFAQSDLEHGDNITTFAKVCLMPDKTQYKYTSMVAGSRHPEFNSIMYFKGMTLQEMHQMSLRIILYARDKNGVQSNLGEVTVSLENFDITAENVLNENFNTRICASTTGSFRMKLLR